MPVNPIFDFYNYEPEKELVQDILMEAIAVYGTNIYYIPRTEVKYDSLYGADEVATYDSYHIVEMYLKNVNGFEGEGTFLSKFNIQIRDQIVLTVAQRSWEIHVGQKAGLNVPKEGDLIWYPMMKRLFVIRYVNKRAMFYQIGDLQVYDLTCEFFEYSSERFNTGIPEVDKISSLHSTDMEAFSITDEEGNIVSDETDEPIADEQSEIEERMPERTDTDIVQNESDDVAVFDEDDPWSEGRY